MPLIYENTEWRYWINYSDENVVFDWHIKRLRWVKLGEEKIKEIKEASIEEVQNILANIMNNG